MRKITLFGPILIMVIAVYLVGLRIYENRTVAVVAPNQITVSNETKKSPKSEEDEDESINSIGDKINLNSAVESELQHLDGVGEVLASRIIERREELGGYTSKEQLLEVEGIGEKLYNEIKDYITIE